MIELNDPIFLVAAALMRELESSRAVKWFGTDDEIGTHHETCAWMVSLFESELELQEFGPVLIEQPE